jgi:hypothetical protein
MAFEEIKAKLGLDITDFEKGMLNANKAAQQTALAQQKLSDFRRNKALSEANDAEKIIILQKELADLYALQTEATAGTAPYLKAQLEIEKKLVEIGKVRQNQREAEKIALEKNAAKQVIATPIAAPTSGGFVDFRKSVLEKANALGAGGLLKGFGVAALVAEFLKAGQAAQTVRDRARETGDAVEYTTGQAARLADAFGSARNILSGPSGLFQTIMAIPVDAFDGLIAGASALAGIGNVSENLQVLREDPAITAAKNNKIILEKNKLLQESDKAEIAFSIALAELEQSRVNALYEQLSIQDQILFKQEELKMAKQDVLKTEVNTISAIKAEQDVVKVQSELTRLINERDQAALESKKGIEEQISAEKEKQLAKEQELAAAREASAKKLAAAQQTAALAGQAYSKALSDQSAASLAEVIAGTRGSARDQKAALKVQDLRTQAQKARDQGRGSLIGGQFVSEADILSQKANQIQSGITSLSTSERDPLAAVTEQLIKSNEELATIRESLTIMEVQY